MIIQHQTTTSPQPAIDFIYRELADRLDRQQKVLWLIPGGSVIPVAVEIMSQLHSHPLANLFITLTDERFGPPNHPNENYRQLHQAGLDPKSARWYRPISQSDIARSTQEWGRVLHEQLVHADFSIGLFGIGPDGHTAGLLPNSPALQSDQLTAHFEGHDHPRMTITPKLISQLDLAVAHAFGSNKWPELRKLLQQDLSPSTQPAQALKQAKQAALFSDINI